NAPANTLYGDTQSPDDAPPATSLVNADRIYGDTGPDVIYGGAGSDLVYALAGNDQGFGNARDDTVFPRAGDDLLAGGAANDPLFGEAGNTVIWGADALLPLSSFDTANPANFIAAPNQSEMVNLGAFTPPRLTPAATFGLSLDGTDDGNDTLVGGDSTD